MPKRKIQHYVFSGKQHRSLKRKKHLTETSGIKKQKVYHCIYHEERHICDIYDCYGVDYIKYAISCVYIN